MLRFALMACVAAVAFAGPVQAMSYTTAGAVAVGGGNVGDPGIGVGEVLIACFDGNDIAGYDPAHSSGFGFFTGSYSGVAAAPAGDASQYMAIATGGSVLFDLRDLGTGQSRIDSLSVYLGSIDTYNFIDVLGLDSSGNLDSTHPLMTIGGADLPPSNGDWYNSQTNRRLTLSFDAADHVGGLIFRSNGVAFEFDSIAVGTSHVGSPGQNSTAAVPEPASWAMMLGGFGMIGGAMRSRRSKLAFARA
jgi:hypothetical protein